MKWWSLIFYNRLFIATPHSSINSCKMMCKIRFSFSIFAEKCRLASRKNEIRLRMKPNQIAPVASSSIVFVAADRTKLNTPRAQTSTFCLGQAFASSHTSAETTTKLFILGNRTFHKSICHWIERCVYVGAISKCLTSHWPKLVCLGVCGKRAASFVLLSQMRAHSYDMRTHEVLCEHIGKARAKRY